MRPDVILRNYWTAIEQRNWERAESLLAPDLVIEQPDSGRVFRGREAFMTFNRTYPGEWHLAVVRTIANEREVAVEVAAINNGVREACLGFYTLQEDRIARGTEWWMTLPDSNEVVESTLQHG